MSFLNMREFRWWILYFQFGLEKNFYIYWVCLSEVCMYIVESKNEVVWFVFGI